MKTLIKTFIALSFLLSFAQQLSAYDFQAGGLYYNITSATTVEVTSGDIEYTGTLNIPSVVTYNEKSYEVTFIGEHAFYKCSGLTGDLVIPNSVTTISAFNVVFSNVA